MTHDQAVDRMPDLLTGALPPEERGPLEAHLDSCAACRERFARYTALWLSDGRAPEGMFARPDPELYGVEDQDRAARGAPRPPWRPALILAAAALALFAVLRPRSPELLPLGPGEEIASPDQAPRLRLYAWTGEGGLPITDGRLSPGAELRASTSGDRVYGVAGGAARALAQEGDWWRWPGFGGRGRVVALAAPPGGFEALGFAPSALAGPDWTERLDQWQIRYRAVEIQGAPP